MAHAPSTANPSTPTKSPLHLPNEILQRVAQLADDEDLPALRATFRVFRDETEDRFADAFFTNVYYPATPEGRERLTKIAEHPLFSQKVRNCIGTTKENVTDHGAYQMNKALGDVAAVMQARNFGVVLVDDRSQGNQNWQAVQYAAYLARYELDKFTVDVQCSVESTSNKLFGRKSLYFMRLNIGHRCTFVVRFLHGKARNAPTLATLEVSRCGRKLTGTGSNDYFYRAETSISVHQLVEIDFFEWKSSGSSPDDSLQHIVEHQSCSLRRLVVRDAHTTTSWKHKELVDTIMSCQLDYCHLSNLTSSGDGVEFIGTLEASGMDNIRACLQDMKWTSKTEEEEVFEIA